MYLVMFSFPLCHRLVYRCIFVHRKSKGLRRARFVFAREVSAVCKTRCLSAQCELKKRMSLLRRRWLCNGLVFNAEELGSERRS